MIVNSKGESKLQIKVIHRFLTQNVIQEVKDTTEHCICYTIYKGKAQVGFLRIVTNFDIVYILDVFISLEYRGKGYTKQLMTTIVNDPELKQAKIWRLKPMDPNGLEDESEFTELDIREE